MRLRDLLLVAVETRRAVRLHSLIAVALGLFLPSVAFAQRHVIDGQPCSFNSPDVSARVAHYCAVHQACRPAAGEAAYSFGPVAVFSSYDCQRVRNGEIAQCRSVKESNCESKVPQCLPLGAGSGGTNGGLGSGQAAGHAISQIVMGTPDANTMMLGGLDMGIAANRHFTRIAEQAKAKRLAEEQARLERERIAEIERQRVQQENWRKTLGQMRMSSPEPDLAFRLEDTHRELGVRFEGADPTLSDPETADLIAGNQGTCFFSPGCAPRSVMESDVSATSFVDLRNLRRGAILARRTVYAPGDQRDSITELAVLTAAGGMPGADIADDGSWPFSESSLLFMQKQDIEYRKARDSRNHIQTVFQEAQRRRETLATATSETRKVLANRNSELAKELDPAKRAALFAELLAAQKVADEDFRKRQVEYERARREAAYREEALRGSIVYLGVISMPTDDAVLGTKPSLLRGVVDPNGRPYCDCTDAASRITALRRVSDEQNTTMAGLFTQIQEARGDNRAAKREKSAIARTRVTAELTDLAAKVKEKNLTLRRITKALKAGGLNRTQRRDVLDFADQLEKQIELIDELVAVPQKVEDAKKLMDALTRRDILIAQLVPVDDESGEELAAMLGGPAGGFLGRAASAYFSFETAEVSATEAHQRIADLDDAYRRLSFAHDVVEGKLAALTQSCAR